MGLRGQDSGFRAGFCSTSIIAIISIIITVILIVTILIIITMIIVYIASCKVVEVSGFGLVRALLSALGTGCVVLNSTPKPP